MRYLSMARRFSPAESHLTLLTSVLANAPYAIEHFLPEPSRDTARLDWLEHTWRALWDATPGSGSQLAWARAVASAAAMDGSRAAGIRSILEAGGSVPTGLSLDPDLRWGFWGALAATGHADDADLDGELRRDDTGSGRTAYLRASFSRPDPDVKEKAWESIFHDRTLSNEHLGAIIAGFRAGARHDLVEGYAADYFASIRSVWEERSIEIARRIVVGLFPSEPTLDAADGWLDTNADAPAALRRLVLEQRDHLARDLRAQAFNSRSDVTG